MSIEIKSDSWVIESFKRVVEKVIFEEPLTKEQAKLAYLQGDFEDIIDTDDEGIEEVLGLEVMNG